MSNENETQGEESTNIMPVAVDEAYPDPVEQQGIPVERNEDPGPYAKGGGTVEAEPIPVNVVEEEYVPVPEDELKPEVYGNDHVTIANEVAKAAAESLDKRLILPMTENMDRLLSVINAFAKNTEAVLTNLEQSYISHLILSGQTLSNNSRLQESFNRPEGDWKQGVDHEGVMLRMAKPSFDKPGNGAVIAGRQAVYHVNSLMGLGSIVNIPLWSSGIWLTLKAPTNATLLELDQRLAALKIELGSNTVGLIFSNDVAYMVMEVVNMALKHVIDASVNDLTPESLKRLILTADIPALIWGFATAIYTDGYPMTRTCHNVQCRHEEHFMLKLNLLSHVDNSMISRQQRLHMTKARTKVDVAAIKEYQSLHKWVGVNDYIELNGKALRVKLKVPNLHEYEISAHDWIDGIVNTMESSLSEPLKGQDRADYIQKQSRMTALRQYGHWISNVTTSTEHVIEDNDTLTTILEHLSGDEAVSRVFFEKVAAFIDDTAINIVGIPKYPCSQCGEAQSNVDPKHPMIIALDPVELFFTLMTQRIAPLLI